VRRIATAVPVAVATVLAVLTLSTGTALAHDGGARHEGRAQGEHARHGEHGEHADHGDHGDKRGKRAHSLVILAGVVSDTPTATIGTTSDTASDTATSTITILVQSGERALRGQTVVVTVDKSTVVRSEEGRGSATALRRGDQVCVLARRMPDGSWLALRIKAAGRHEDDARHEHEDRG
jgi:hypothetical protein